MTVAAPIGMFDSGIGGLTVFHAVQSLLPHESILYLGDTARVPYGNKSAETVVRYSRENAQFLADRGVKALVVACNSSSAYALDALRECSPGPVLGVIEPGAEAALEVSTTKRIGVLGTAATVASQAYAQAIKARCPEAQVVSRACPLLVPLVEEGWLAGRVAEEIVRHYVSPLLSDGIDTVILGCTHYPLLREVLQQIMGDQITLVDSAAATARALRRVLMEAQLLTPGVHPPKYQLYVTDAAPQFQSVAARFLGGPLPPVTTVAL